MSKIIYSTAPLFSATMSGDQTVEIRNVVIKFSSVAINRGGLSASGGLITINKGGVYRINATIWYRNARCWIKLDRSGNNLGESINTATDFGVVTLDRVVFLNSGDVVSVKSVEDRAGLIVNSGTNNSSTSNINIEYLGPAS